MKDIAMIVFSGLILSLSGCVGTDKKPSHTQKVILMTLDPGHFHAALVQKSMYDQVDSTVFVYGPKGQDVKDHLKRIEGFNSREENPTSWIEKVYTGSDYLDKMIEEKPGNVVIVSGNNSRKTKYIKRAVDAGLNVFADKPMAINEADFMLLEEAFNIADEKGVLIYDIMTERFEITTRLQRELSTIPAIFGELQTGSEEEPALTKVSVHHFFKYVSGNPLKRPAWYFDTKQQGEGIVDVTTHLVDLILWEAFPEKTVNRENIELISACRWTTDLSIDMFEKVTGMNTFPDYLYKDVSNDTLRVYSNGEIIFKVNGKYAKVSVQWNYQAPEGTGDTHFSTMNGSKSRLIIRQGIEEDFKPTLYVESVGFDNTDSFESDLSIIFEKIISIEYPGVKLVKLAENLWKVDIPEEYKVGHEAHFGQVTENYLRYLNEENLPEWEVPNMITKYFITTQALKLAKDIE